MQRFRETSRGEAMPRPNWAGRETVERQLRCVLGLIRPPPTVRVGHGPTPTCFCPIPLFGQQAR